MSNCPEGKICFNKEIFLFFGIILSTICVLGYINFDKNRISLQNNLKKSNNISEHMDNYFYIDNEKNKHINCNNDSQLSSNLKDMIKPNISNNSRKHISKQFSNIDNRITTNINPEMVTYPIRLNYQSPQNNSNVFIDNNRQGVPINIPTQGFISQFNQIGVVHNKNKKQGNIILPLYGKQLYRGSNKWQYYVTTDGFNNIKLDIRFKNKMGLGEHGCDELSDKDIIRIPSYRQPFIVNLYNLEKPIYIPYIN